MRLAQVERTLVAIIAATVISFGQTPPVSATHNVDQKWKYCPLASYDHMINWGWVFGYEWSSSAEGAIQAAVGKWSAVGREWLGNGPVNIYTTPSSYCIVRTLKAQIGGPNAGAWAEEINYKYLGFGAIQDARMTFNYPAPWGCTWYFGTSSPGQQQIDLRTVAVHEFGHAVSIGHVSASSYPSSVMTPINCGENQRNLGSHDVAGISYLYPAH